MKKLSVFILLSFFVFLMNACEEKEDLNGQWKLIQVETPDGVLIPQVDFLIQVTDQKINFNLDVNKCFAEIEIRNDSIIYHLAGCTKMCCDGQIDTIGSFLNYSGAYSFKNDLLHIQNENLYMLKKMDHEN